MGESTKDMTREIPTDDYFFCHSADAGKCLSTDVYGYGQCYCWQRHRSRSVGSFGDIRLA